MILLVKYRYLFVGIILLFASSNLNWGGDNWKSMLEADAKGYYAYLPAIFIYQDLNFGFFKSIEEQKYFNKDLYYDYRADAYGKTVNKYFCGTAVLQLPFFLSAHLFTKIMGDDADGFSKWYLIFINLAAIFYLFLGLFYLDKVWQSFEISVNNRTLLLFLLVFGTNVYCYTIIDPGMSHIYSFPCFVGFIYLGINFFKQKNIRSIYLMALLLGLIVLIRPINGMLLFSVPFLAGSWEKLKEGFVFLFKNITVLLSSTLLFFSVIGIQLLVYKIQCGHFWVYSYGDEGFNFSDPQIFNILFSYKKGLFLYTPICLISLAGFYYLHKRNSFQSMTLFLFMAFVSYVLSSWWNWWYGGSFSSRVYLEYLPFFFILLSVCLQDIRSKFGRTTIITSLFLLTIICQIQIWQYRYYHIHYENMTKEKYWDVFLRIDKLI